MLRILHRRLLGELALNALGTLAAVLAMIFLAALSLQMGKASVDDLPMTVILRSVALLVVHTLHLTLPLSVLATCIFTYGRLAQDGEFSAVRTSGVHPWHALAPGLGLGACVMLGLAALQDRVMPEAHYQTRLASDGVLRHIDVVLEGADHRLSVGKSFAARWSRRGRDERGRLVLEDLYLVQFAKDGARTGELTAARATPALDAEGRRLLLELEDVHRTTAGRDGVEILGAASVEVDLGALAQQRSGRRKPVQMTLEELLSAAGRRPDTPAARGALSEYHYRIASAASAPLFALLGAPLGLRLRIRNRALVFLIGLLIVGVAYWPVTALIKNLAESGKVPPWLLHAPPAALLIVALRELRKACRG